MKKAILPLLIFPLVLLAGSLQAASAPNVNEYLLKAFAAAYPAAEKISWSMQDGHNVVHFFNHDVRCVMEYDSEAKVIHSIRYYSDPGMLPQNVTWEWHRRFPEKTLFGITEVSDGEDTAWFLKGQDAKHWITVKAYADGAMEVVEKIKKQS